MGEIVNVSVDESVLDKDGKIDPDKLRPITFDPILVGSGAQSDGKATVGMIARFT